MTSANTILVLVRMSFALISQKVLAILIGAEGIAQVGNLKNVVSFFEQFTILGTSNGLVKYIAEHKNDKAELNKLFSTAFVFTSFGTVLSFIVLFFCADLLNNFIFGSDENYVFVFKILAFIIPFMGINALLYSLLNGLSSYKIYSKSALSTIVMSTVLIVTLTYRNGLSGSLVAISVFPVLQILSYLMFYSGGYTQYVSIRKIRFDLSFKNQLLTYSFMSVTVILLINVTDIAIRNLIEQKLNASEAGYWTGMTSISKTYMQFLAAIFPIYILPKYANITNTFDFRKEVKKIYKLLLPILIIGMSLVFVFRNLIIQLLYTKSFLAMGELFIWQLLGDLIKFIALVLSYIFLAKKQVMYYVFTELLSVFLFYILAQYFILTKGTQGVVIAHFIRYIIYLFVVLLIFRKYFIGKNIRI
ncbi:LPS biosynthesis protein [Algibacter mikhailovii]|uniref:LPS biosynthesis protein n=1 Tax=Algibacter mikhailovii TaxID=425498 RepID=A0A918R2E5_9FLAO|nr:LPS biosynthesis protein [Algibacter mikhailovii]